MSTLFFSKQTVLSWAAWCYSMLTSTLGASLPAGLTRKIGYTTPQITQTTPSSMQDTTHEQQQATMQETDTQRVVYYTISETPQRDRLPSAVFNRYYIPRLFFLESWYKHIETPAAVAQKHASEYPYCLHKDALIRQSAKRNYLKATSYESVHFEIADADDIISVTLHSRPHSAFRYRYPIGIDVTDMIKEWGAGKGEKVGQPHEWHLVEMIPGLLIRYANAASFPVDSLYFIFLLKTDDWDIYSKELQPNDSFEIKQKC